MHQVSRFGPVLALDVASMAALGAQPLQRGSIGPLEGHQGALLNLGDFHVLWKRDPGQRQASQAWRFSTRGIHVVFSSF